MTNYKKWLWSSQKDTAAPSTSKGLEYCPNTTYLNLTRIASLSTCAEPDARTLKDEQGALGTWTWSLSMTGSLLERKLLRRCSQCQLQVKTCEKEKIAKKNKTCNYQCYEDQIGWYFGEVIDYIIYECDFHLHHCRIKSYLSHYCASFIEGLKITNVTICSLKLGQFQLHPDFPRDNSPTPRFGTSVRWYAAAATARAMSDSRAQRASGTGNTEGVPLLPKIHLDQQNPAARDGLEPPKIQWIGYRYDIHT